MSSLQFQIALTLLPGIGHTLAKNLVSYSGGAEAVFKERKHALTKIPGIADGIADKLTEGKKEALLRAEKECAFIEKQHIKHIFYTEKEYPQRLKNCADSPVLLFYKGNFKWNASKVLAVIGTRSSTDYGKTICDRLIEDFKTHDDLIIVSGLAYGIDICAHKAALKSNISTVGVIAHGLDKMYPPIHKSTADKMLENGGIVTEHISGSKPDRENFPKRNRIVAGMSDAVIVVESAIKGGALITAEIANSYNRDVFAVPGDINKEFSAGCNWLIKSNKACLVQTAADIEYAMGWDKKMENRKAVKQKQLLIDLSDDEKLLVDYLTDKSKVDIDSICIYAGIQVSKVASVLLGLELKGAVKMLPGRVYELV